MLKDIPIELFLESYDNYPLIDVRSPGEFEKGHIPGAVNIPLFSDDERADVGTVYKQESREKAMELGYTYVNPKLDHFITESQKVAADGKVVVHCWRGGMRSHAFAEHLNKNGFDEVYVIEKGYKAYRTLAVNDYEKGDLRVLGGYTGSGKTYILQELLKLGQQIIDLEEIAQHKGSAFGRIGMGQQPTTEQFGNNLYWEWRKLDFSKPIWIEDESLNIGKVNLPDLMFKRIRESHLLFLEISKEERAKHLVNIYSIGLMEKLIGAMERISHQLGKENSLNAIEHLKEGDFYSAAVIALSYYDKYYKKGMKKRDPEKITMIPLPDADYEKNAKKLISI